jgi:hypothetical protein
MSHTTILAVYPGERVEPLRELRNSWGTAEPVWQYLYKRFLHSRLQPWNHDRLWTLWNNHKVPEHYRAILLVTFDRALVRKEHFARAAADIRKADSMDEGQGNAYHWPLISDIFASNPDVPAIGLWCTSVSVNPFLGKYNADKRDHDPFDWSTAVDVYGEIDKPTANDAGEREP